MASKKTGKSNTKLCPEIDFVDTFSHEFSHSHKTEKRKTKTKTLLL